MIKAAFFPLEICFMTKAEYVQKQFYVKVSKAKKPHQFLLKKVLDTQCGFLYYSVSKRLPTIKVSSHLR